MPTAPKAHRPRQAASRPAPRRDTRASASERGYDSRWAKLREWYVAQHPLCWHCLGFRTVEPATEVDHIVPLSKTDPFRDPLRLDPDNLQPLCVRHHRIKTRRQKARWSMSTVVVTGPPCSGKTTYVQFNAKPGDFIWDTDVVASSLAHRSTPHDRPEWTIPVTAALRDEAIKRFLGQCPEAGCWVIVTDRRDAERCATQYRATLHVIDTPVATCMDRALKAGRPHSTLAAIAQWGKAA